MKKILMLAVALAAASSVTKAAELCASGESIIGTGGSITVTPGQTYTSTFSCQLGNTVFSNFSVVTNAGFPATSLFNLALSVNTGGSELDFAVTLAAGEDLRLYYQIASGVDGMTLSAAGAGSTITETACSQAFSGTTCNGTVLANFAASSNQTVSAAFSEIVPVDYIFKDIQAGNGISDFTQTIIPEPMTLSLMGAGLLGLGILGRRRMKK